MDFRWWVCNSQAVWPQTPQTPQPLPPSAYSAHCLAHPCCHHHPGQHRQSPSPSMSTVSCPEYGELQDRLQRLAIARESLSLQVSVLTEQVGAQSEKIKDLESLLDEKGCHNTPDIASFIPSDMEGNKVDLLAEVASLKAKFGSLERDKLETEQRLRFATSEISKLQKALLSRAPQSDPPPPAPPQPPMDPNELNSLVHKLRHRSKDAADEIEVLRQRVEQLASANNEKELHIEQLRTVLQHQARMSERLYPEPAPNSAMPRSISAYAHHHFAPHFSDPHNTDMDINHQLRTLLAEESGAFPNSSSYPEGLAPQPNGGLAQAPYGGGQAPAIQSSSSYTSSLSALTGTGSSPSANWSPRAGQAEGGKASPAGRLLAAELDELASTSREARLPNGGVSYPSSYYTGSLPRRLEKPPPGPGPRRGTAATASSRGRTPGKRAPSPAGWLGRKLRAVGKTRSTSAPNLAESDDETIQSASQLNEKLKRDKKNRSLRNLFSKLKRSSSGEVGREDAELGDGSGFKRGVGGRATAGPRLGPSWTAPPSQHIPVRPPLQLFHHWAPQQLGDWLVFEVELGLGAYAANARRVLQSGRHLITMTQGELEKDLELRNPLHRKKLTLSLRAIEEGKAQPHERMDHHQVLRWLDDVGLPQYRDAFAEARIDGQMLDRLTVEDLLALKVPSALHQASLARGIQMLRVVGWNLGRLRRKLSAEELEGEREDRAASVQLWTHHCVAEWLRSIDLGEFTPNLMCAGIHGALLVLEPTFTAETLAEVLAMSDAKTLLRRHLSTHFNRLLGPDLVAAKREALALPFHHTLSPLTKVKPLKKGFSLSRKKSKTEIYMEPDELVAPPTPHPEALRLRASSALSLPPPAPLTKGQSASASRLPPVSHLPPAPPPPSRRPELTDVISEDILENLASSNV